MKKTFLRRAALPALLAAVFFFFTFRGPRKRFWQRMTGTGLSLGTLALVTQPELRKTRIGPKEIILGLLSAAQQGPREDFTCLNSLTFFNCLEASLKRSSLILSLDRANWWCNSLSLLVFSALS